MVVKRQICQQRRLPRLAGAGGVPHGRGHAHHVVLGRERDVWRLGGPGRALGRLGGGGPDARGHALPAGAGRVHADHDPRRLQRGHHGRAARAGLAAARILAVPDNGEAGEEPQCRRSSRSRDTYGGSLRCVLCAVAGSTQAGAADPPTAQDGAVRHDGQTRRRGPPRDCLHGLAARVQHRLEQPRLAARAGGGRRVCEPLSPEGIRSVATKFFLAHYTSSSPEEQQKIDKAIQNLYYPTLKGGWGVSPVQTRRFVARRSDKKMLLDKCAELQKRGYSWGKAAEVVYTEFAQPIVDAHSYCDYMRPWPYLGGQ
ncbi:hypothetical protein ON010_g18292 [Phytophthora cinnamomi]|nr:hypothetical protein ON010_g18292 [Phytophthora cinnamomi]